MNLLVLSPWFPCPPDNGSRLRAFHLLRHLAARHRVRLVTGRQTDRAGDDALSDDDLRAQLGCESVVSTPWRWHRAGEGGPGGALRALFSPLPRSILETDNPPLHDAVHAQLARPTDAVLALQLGAAPFVPPAAQAGHAPPVVLDEIEMSGLVHARQDAASARARLRAGMTAWKSERYWRRATRRFAALTAVSDDEASAVRKAIGEPGDGAPPVVVVPNGVDVSSYQRGASGVAPISGRLLYNGALGYGPNRDAVAWFVREVLPRIAELSPGAHLVVTGRTDDVDDETRNALGANSRVYLTGFLPDLRPALDASQVCVVPLRLGGGTRLKILEAFAAGLPVVATTRGAAGIRAEHGRHLLLADTPDEIASTVARLLQRPGEAAALAREARHLVEEHYDWPAIAGGLSDLLERVAAIKESGA